MAASRAMFSVGRPGPRMTRQGSPNPSGPAGAPDSDGQVRFPLLGVAGKAEAEKSAEGYQALGRQGLRLEERHHLWVRPGQVLQGWLKLGVRKEAYVEHQ